jgi:cell shape-determining protein MreC
MISQFKPSSLAFITLIFAGTMLGDMVGIPWIKNLKSNIHAIYNSPNFIYHDYIVETVDMAIKSYVTHQQQAELEKLKTDYNYALYHLQNLLRDQFLDIDANSVIVSSVSSVINNFRHSHTVTINQENVGKVVANSSLVVDDKGYLVGFITKNSTTWAELNLITDSDSIVPVLIGKIKSIAIGEGRKNYLKLAHVIKSETKSFRDGDLVLLYNTAGDTINNIPIGKLKYDNLNGRWSVITNIDYQAKKFRVIKHDLFSN